jgi:hypothetical protein
MQEQSTPSLKILIYIIMFIIGSLIIAPNHQLMAQSCGAGEPTHVVSSGENLFRIALRYGVSMEAVTTRNGISDMTRIFAGTTLCIPAGGTVSATTQTIVQTTVVTATPSSPPTTTTTTTTTAPSGQENWCSNGGPWADGRCIVPGNPFLQDYWFLAGWCNAQVGLGNYQGSVDDCLNGATGMTNGTSVTVTTFNYDLVDDDDEFACTIIYDKYTGTVTSLAVWDDDYDDQDQVIFFTNLPNLFNYAVTLGEDDEQAGISKITDLYKTFSRASAKLKMRDEEGDITGQVGIVDCDRIES